MDIEEEAVLLLLFWVYAYIKSHLDVGWSAEICEAKSVLQNEINISKN